jgi:hypothetical protein
MFGSRRLAETSRSPVTPVDTVGGENGKGRPELCIASQFIRSQRLRPKCMTI